jgi:hypothetical protein
MNAICGLSLPLEMARKSSSVKVKLASGFPAYGPAQRGQRRVKNFFRNMNQERKFEARPTRHESRVGAGTCGDGALLEVHDEDLLVDAHLLSDRNRKSSSHQAKLIQRERGIKIQLKSRWVLGIGVRTLGEMWSW